jgi:surface protein
MSLNLKVITTILVATTLVFTACEVASGTNLSINTDQTYSVVYVDNGADVGEVPTDQNTYNEGDVVTVLANSGSLAKPGYDFGGWNTAADGSGTNYADGETFAMPAADIVLHTNWISTYNITYDGNGHTDGTVPQDSNNYKLGETVTVLANSGNFTKDSYRFNGWNTESDGSGTHYLPNDTFNMGITHVQLYAQWQELLITRFDFLASNNTLSVDVTGSIDGSTIRLNVPIGTNLSTLIPTIAHNGDSINPANGTTINFSTDQTYTVTAPDGSTFDYNVMVFTTVENRSQLDLMIMNDEDVTRVDTSQITDMSQLFKNKSVFDQDISLWDVSSVTNMSEMLYGATAFNQDISIWDVASVTDMSHMFHGATAFNQDIFNWDVASVTDMSHMFRDASSFNQNIGAWDVINVTDMSYMFLVCCFL